MNDYPTYCERTKMVPKSKGQTLLEGDANNKYFHLMTNGKHMKTRMFQLEQEEGILSVMMNLKSISPSIIKARLDLMNPLM